MWPDEPVRSTCRTYQYWYYSVAGSWHKRSSYYVMDVLCSSCPHKWDWELGMLRGGNNNRSPVVSYPGGLPTSGLQIGNREKSRLAGSPNPDNLLCNYKPLTALVSSRYGWVLCTYVLWGNKSPLMHAMQRCWLASLGWSGSGGPCAKYSRWLDLSTNHSELQINARLAKCNLELPKQVLLVTYLCTILATAAQLERTARRTCRYNT